jgi:hypothetical protein
MHVEVEHLEMDITSHCDKFINKNSLVAFSKEAYESGQSMKIEQDLNYMDTVVELPMKLLEAKGRRLKISVGNFANKEFLATPGILHLYPTRSLNIRPVQLLIRNNSSLS